MLLSLYNKDGSGNVRIQNPINGMLFEVAREALSSLPETSSGFEDLPPLKTEKLLSGIECFSSSCMNLLRDQCRITFS